MLKYGIMFKPTMEWIGWYDIDLKQDVLFTPDEDKAKNALFDVLNTDGGYDGNHDDFAVMSKEMPLEFNGSEYLTDNTVFVDSDIIRAKLSEE